MTKTVETGTRSRSTTSTSNEASTSTAKMSQADLAQKVAEAVAAIRIIKAKILQSKNSSEPVDMETPYNALTKIETELKESA